MATTQTCPCRVNAAIDKKGRNVLGCVPIKLCLQTDRGPDMAGSWSLLVLCWTRATLSAA